MKILLDTNVFIWMSTKPALLPEKVQNIWQDHENTLYLSAISASEIAIKHHLNKLRLPDSPSIMIPKERMAHGILSISLDEESSLLLESLPLLHRDPFDRLLICQALTHDLTILTPDKQIRQYEVETVW